MNPEVQQAARAKVALMQALREQESLNGSGEALDVEARTRLTRLQIDYERALEIALQVDDPLACALLMTFVQPQEVVRASRRLAEGREVPEWWPGEARAESVPRGWTGHE